MPRRTNETTTENGVYRTPGRVVADAPLPLPSRGALFSPLARGIGWVALLVAPPFLFNVLVAQPVIQLSPGLRFIPMLERIQDVLAIALVASLPIMIHRIVRRVRPTWSGMRRCSRFVYVFALLLAQVSALGAAEFILMMSRGGFPLWEPTLRTTTTAPDSRTAYLYAGGFGCQYDVYVANPYGMTMQRTLTVSRNSCQEPTPRVDFKPDGSLQLLDSEGKPVGSQSSGWGFSWGGGC